jgi:hypothetical protein
MDRVRGLTSAALSLASCAYVVCYEKIKSRVTNVNKMCMRAAVALLATGHISTLCVRAKANVRQNNLFSGRKMGFQEHAAALRGLLFSHTCTMNGAWNIKAGWTQSHRNKKL